LRDQFPHNSDSLRYGNNRATIYDYGILDSSGRVCVVLDYDHYYDIIAKIEFHDYIESPIFAFTIKDSKGMEITGTNSVMKHIDTLSYKKGDKITVTFGQNISLRPGQYALSLGCVAINDSGIEVYSRLYDIILFEVIGSQEMVGFFDLKSDITIDLKQ
jgi:teichoic acid transport system ATP-binding protein